MFLGHSRNPCVADAIDELPKVELDPRAQLPCKAAALVLLLVHVAERRFHVRRRDAETAANDRRAASATAACEPIGEIAQEEVETV